MLRVDKSRARVILPKKYWHMALVIDDILAQIATRVGGTFLKTKRPLIPGGLNLGINTDDQSWALLPKPESFNLDIREEDTFTNSETVESSGYSNVLLELSHTDDGHTYERLCFPLYLILKGVKGTGRHTVYLHHLRVGGRGLQYVGITGKPWYERYKQHRNLALKGSRFAFHQVLRDGYSHLQHNVIDICSSYENAMKLEEIVSRRTLVPQGLNMIPGGFLGLKTLYRLGLLAKNEKRAFETTDEIIAREIARKGQASIFVRALWADNAKAEEMVCGQKSRFSVGQVRMIRYLDSLGLQVEDIAEAVFDPEQYPLIDEETGALNTPRADLVRNILTGKTYARVR